MSDEVKSVQLNMSDADLKAFSRGTTRRRRTKRSEANAAEEATAVPYGGASSNGGPMPYQVEKSGVDIASLPSPVAPPAVTIPVQLPAQTQAMYQAPTPVLSTTAVVGGGCNPKPISASSNAPTVTIQAKKNAAATPAPIPNVAGGAKSAAKIVPTKKRISAAPAAQTLKKPRLVVPLAAALANPATTSPKNGTESAKVGVIASPVASVPQQKPSKKRRFTERKISIEVKSAKATRKHRRNLKHKIESMPIANVKKLLLRKGVLKPKEDGKMPPEDMMRSMLKDYLLLHTAE